MLHASLHFHLGVHSHSESQVRVVVHGDDFTFESELKKIQAKMCEWYDVMVRGVLAVANETYNRSRYWSEN